jgi:nicotinamidase-related amidase
MSTALLLIDIQNDYFPGGTMELEGSVEASLCARRLVEHFRQRNMPILHVRHTSLREGATFFLPGTHGAGIHTHVAPLETEIVIEKHFPNSFRDTALLDRLRTLGATRVAIAGMMTHMCVDATVRAAFDYGFHCTVASDACATRALQFENMPVSAGHVHAAFLAALHGVYAQVTSTDRIISSLS